MQRSICFFLVLVLGLSSGAQERTDDSLRRLIRDHASPFLKMVLDHPDSFRYQVIYTRIDRDRHNNPQFHNYYYRVNPLEYFNPASTVKMPLAFLALEKMHGLGRRWIDKFSPMLTDSAFSGQHPVYTDSTAVDGLPSLAQYVKKIFLVSDNDAYNRLYEFLGQQGINERLHQMGYKDIRITRRFVPMTEEENRHTNPVRFLAGPGAAGAAGRPAGRRGGEGQVAGGAVGRGVAAGGGGLGTARGRGESAGNAGGVGGATAGRDNGAGKTDGVGGATAGRGNVAGKMGVREGIAGRMSEGGVGEKGEYVQPGAESHFVFDFSRPVSIGKGHYDRNDSLVMTPMDFTRHNNVPLGDLQQLLQSVLFPESVPEGRRFRLGKEDYPFLYRYMSQYPSEEAHPQYDTTEYFDSYTKFWLFKAGKTKIPPYMRVFNKPGWSYGFLTDVAYVVDFKHKVEFMLSGTIYVNRDGILNDDKYEYEEIGYPFFKELGEIIYRYELERRRPFVPDLHKFILAYDKSAF